MDNTDHIEGAERATDDFVDDYTVDVETAAQLLGIGTTRLSQITSRGSLSFQRRKVGFRNRMFYRKSEIEAYLEKNFPASVQYKSQMLAERWASTQDNETPAAAATPSLPTQESLNLEPLVAALKQMPFIRKHKTVAAKTKTQHLPSAVAVREKTELDAKINAILQGLHVFQQSLVRVERKLDAIQKRERAAQQSLMSTKNFPSALSTSSQPKVTKMPKWPRVHKKNAQS